jgi:hypothetical protein
VAGVGHPGFGLRRSGHEVSVTTFMVLGGVLIAFLVAVMPAALAPGTPATAVAEPAVDPAPTPGPATGPMPDLPDKDTRQTWIVAGTAAAAILIAGVSVVALRRRTSSR